MSISSGDVLRLTLQFNSPLSDLQYVVTHYLATQGSGGDEATILDDVATYLEAAWETNDGSFADTFSSEQAALFRYDFSNHRFDGLGTLPLSAFVGSQISQDMPQGNAGLGKLYTAVARRQGRKYFGGLTENEYTNGTLTGGAVTAISDILDALGDIIVSDGITLAPGVFSVDDESPLYETFEPFIDSYAVETIGSYQRRRKQGVGI
jgi:hypothetical protein